MSDPTSRAEITAMTAEEAISSLHLTAQRIRLLTVFLVVVLLIESLAFSTLLYSKVTTTFEQGRRVGVQNQQLLKLVEGAVGPAATADNQQQTVLLIECLNNRIDFDTGKAALNPACKTLP